MKLAQSRTFKPSKMPFCMGRTAPLICWLAFDPIWASRCNARFFMAVRGRGTLVGRTEIHPAPAPACKNLFLAREKGGIAAGRRRVDRHRLLGGKARQIVRATGLRAGARQAEAAERLHADHRSNHVAVDIDVADREAIDHGLDHVVDTRMDAERQAEAGAFDRGQHVVKAACSIAHHMQDRAEYLFGELTGALELEDMRRDILALRRLSCEMDARLASHPRDMSLQLLFGVREI